MNPEQNPNLSIKQWAEDDRPREKLLLKGRSSLSNAELIAILIATGSREDSAVDLSKKILAVAANSLAGLARLSVSELQKIKGIGQAKAITIVAAMELGRRRKEETPALKNKIIISRDAFVIFEPLVADLQHEVFWVLLLNKANIIIGCRKISEGGVSATIVDAKIVFKYALENLASGIILCHNHPSGNTTPSMSDKRLTQSLKQAAQLLEITLHDHLIVGNGEYYSFSDSGLL